MSHLLGARTEVCANARLADDSALRECDESRGTLYSERHSACGRGPDERNGTSVDAVQVPGSVGGERGLGPLPGRRVR